MMKDLKKMGGRGGDLGLVAALMFTRKGQVCVVAQP